MKWMKVVGVSVVAMATSSTYAELVTAPVTHEHSKTFTLIKIGEEETPAKVTLDTGSSMLVLQEQYVKTYRADAANRMVNMAYGNGKQKMQGRIVYAQVTLNTNPAIIAREVPIVVVPNGTFHDDRAGIMGMEMGNQTSLWKHLPSPYNQMMVINGPQSTVSFGALSDSEMNTFATLQLNEAKCNNSVKPEAAYANTMCWGTRKVPVNYTFTSADGSVLYKATYNTVFDTGGDNTHFFLQPLPGPVKTYLHNKIFQGTVTMSVDSTNQGAVTVPTTSVVGMSKSPRNVVNSGNQVFYDKTVLFDARDGVVGFK